MMDDNESDEDQDINSYAAFKHEDLHMDSEEEKENSNA